MTETLMSETASLADLLRQLEVSLRLLDQMGADIAASHVDAAIQNVIMEYAGTVTAPA